MDQTLGKRIVSNRKRLGMTQDKLAERLGVTAQAVSKWENDLACPDISTLPKLSALFGITTDELLGIADTPAREAEVVDDDGCSNNAPDFELRWDNDRKSTLCFALWILSAGAILLAAGMFSWQIGLWDTLWTTGLTMFGLFGLFSGLSFFRMGCTLFGIYSLLDKLDAAPFRLGKELILPSVLLLFGLSLLIDALKKPRTPTFTVSRKGKRIFHRRGHRKTQNTYHTDGEHFDCSCSFGVESRRITLPRLSSGEISCSFAELTVDLTGCTQIADRCRIDATCSFGELVILVPSDCRVDPITSTAFGDVDFEGHAAADADTIIVMNCSANFGQITIRYI